MTLGTWTHFFTGENEDKTESLSHGFVMKTGQEHMGKVPGTKGCSVNGSGDVGGGERDVEGVLSLRGWASFLVWPFRAAKWAREMKPIS